MQPLSAVCRGGEFRGPVLAGRRKYTAEFCSLEFVDAKGRLALVRSAVVSDIDGSGSFCRIDLLRAGDGLLIALDDSLNSLELLLGGYLGHGQS